MINFCEICNSKKYLVKTLNLGSLPLVDDLIKINSKKKSKLYKTQILYCNKCYTAYQKYNVKKKILFPNQYHYRSSLTNDVIMGMEGLVKDTKKFVNTYKNKVVLDVGCNDGILLSRFKREKAITVGIEPTGAAYEAKKKGHDIFKDYINLKTVNKIKKKYNQIDIITFTHVFAHIDNLKYLISCVKKLMNKNTILVIENHYLGSVLEKKQFDTFYHEHPRTYSQRSFIKIAKKIRANLIHCSFPKRYGGNIRVVITKSKNNKIKIKNESSYFHRLKKLQASMEKWKKRKREQLILLSNKYGPLSAKAFPGRASILIKLLNINEKVISEVYEKPNSKKIGHYLPGTSIPIKSDNKFFNKKNKIKIIINLAWHINKEIRIYLRKMGYKGKIIDILETKDFK